MIDYQTAEKITFYLTRHALATHSTTGYGDEILSAQILPEGIPPIKSMAHFLKDIPTDQNVSSEVLRCQQTAKIISQITHKKFTPDARLNEFYQDTWKTFEERVLSFLSDCLFSNQKKILLCTHGAVIAVLKNHLTKGFFEVSNEFDYPQTGELWIIQNRKLEKKNFNERTL
jgi:broad specificity phosphatase PhoE